MILTMPLLTITILDNYFSERSNTYINNHVQTYASYIFTELISQSIIKNIDMDNLLIIKYNNSARVDSVIINTKITNQILADVGRQIRQYLNDDELMKTFGSVYIPLAFLISKNIFASRGPKIEIMIIPMGTYKLDVQTTTDLRGINNSVIEVFLSLKVDLEAFLPFQKKQLETVTKIVLVSQLIQGEVPRYYYTSPWFNSFIPENN